MKYRSVLTWQGDIILGVMIIQLGQQNVPALARWPSSGGGHHQEESVKGGSSVLVA